VGAAASSEGIVDTFRRAVRIATGADPESVLGAEPAQDADRVGAARRARSTT
jgi:hypothetical protein